MKQGSFEMSPLEPSKARRFSPRIVAAFAVMAAVIIAVIGAVLLTIVSRDDQMATPAACVPALAAPAGTQLAPKAAHASDYAHIADAPPAPCPTAPADVFPPDSGIGIVFEYAVFKHCALQVDGPDALCRLAYASGPDLLPVQPANPSVRIEGRDYGNCRFDGPHAPVLPSPIQQVARRVPRSLCMYAAGAGALCFRGSGRRVRSRDIIVQLCRRLFVLLVLASTI